MSHDQNEEIPLTEDQKLSLTAATLSFVLYCLGWLFVDMSNIMVLGLNKIAFLLGIAPMDTDLDIMQHVAAFFMWLIIGHLLIAEILLFAREKYKKKPKKHFEPMDSNIDNDINELIPKNIQILCSDNGFKIKPEHISHIKIDRAGGLLRLKEDISDWNEHISHLDSMKYPDDYVKCKNCGEEFMRGARCSNQLHSSFTSVGKKE